MKIKNIVGRNLKKIRLKNKISRHALAFQIGKTPSCIANIESGVRSPSLSLLFTLATFFQEDIRAFLAVEDFETEATTIVTDWNQSWPLVGQNIVRIRKSQGIRQYALAKELDITIAFLCNIENGKCVCSLPMLASLADTLGVDICDLFVLQ